MATVTLDSALAAHGAAPTLADAARIVRAPDGKARDSGMDPYYYNAPSLGALPGEVDHAEAR